MLSLLGAYPFSLHPSLPSRGHPFPSYLLPGLPLFLFFHLQALPSSAYSLPITFLVSLWVLPGAPLPFPGPSYCLPIIPSSRSWSTPVYLYPYGRSFLASLAPYGQAVLSVVPDSQSWVCHWHVSARDSSLDVYPSLDASFLFTGNLNGILINQGLTGRVKIDVDGLKTTLL